MSNVKKYRILHYEPEDFYFVVNNDDNESKFDKLLQEHWENAIKNNIFRYKLNIQESKRLNGKYQFLAQLNLDRASNRRTPEHIQSLSAPFNPNRFNFTKISDNEIYVDLSLGDGNNVITANVSPIEYGHCLFLPQRLQCLPQIVTEFSLFNVVQLLLLSKSPFFRAIFNGLCAYSSVNHLHWHLYYLKYPMLLEEVDLDGFSDPIYTIKDYPARGFCMKLSSFSNNIKSFSSSAYMLINYLQQQLIAHNIYITRAKKSRASINYDDVRIYIWARKANTGIKDTSAFIPAVCELFGHLSIRNAEAYNILNEDDVARCLEEVTYETYEIIKEKLKNGNILRNLKDLYNV